MNEIDSLSKVKSLRLQIRKGLFPSNVILKYLKKNDRNQFLILQEEFRSYLQSCFMDSLQSRHVCQYLRHFYRVIDISKDREFFFLLIHRAELSSLLPLVRLFINKVEPKRRCIEYKMILEMLLTSGRYEMSIITSALAQNCFRELESKLEQKAIIDFLVETLAAEDFLKCLIDVRQHAADVNYHELTFWSSFATLNIEELSLKTLGFLIPGLNFRTIVDQNLLADITKKLRMTKFEFNRVTEKLHSVEDSQRRKLNNLRNTSNIENVPEDLDQTSMYSNFKYSIK